MRISHDEYFLNMLDLVASRSTCPRRSVGAIIVDAHNTVLSTGYNGVPRGFDHCTDNPCPGRHDQAGDSSRCLAVHAEQNALLQCHRPDLMHTLYASCSPCFTCAKMIANTSIKRIVCRTFYAESEGVKVLMARGIEFVKL